MSSSRPPVSARGHPTDPGPPPAEGPAPRSGPLRRPARGEVHVWRIPQPAGAPPPARAARVLDPEELARARRYHREVDRSAFLTSHTALREVLGAALGVAPRALGFALGPHGKPRLVRPPGAERAEELHFNLSGTAGLALLALSVDAPLGVDVERRREDPSLLDVADRFFSPAELRALRGLDPAERLAGFHRVWTRKEAYLKALGLGLALELDSFDVAVGAGPAACLLATRPDPAEALRWRLLDLDVGPEHAAALVVGVGTRGADPLPAVRWFTWSPVAGAGEAPR